MIKCDANKLPEEIKGKAREYVAKRRPRFRTFGIVSDDVECAWLNGFAFCLEGTVEVKVKRCATCVFVDNHCVPSNYEKGGCPEYKSVFSQNAEIEKKLTKAKEIIKKLYPFVRDKCYTTTLFENKERQFNLKFTFTFHEKRYLQDSVNY